VECARAHLEIIGLQDDASLRAPVAVERKDQVLEAQAQTNGPICSVLMALALADGLQWGKCRSNEGTAGHIGGSACGG
jgi:hypothetical protein